MRSHVVEQDKTWFDEAAGPLVRPFTIARGRTRAREDLDMLSLVVAAGEPSAAGIEPEYHDILDLCRTPLSVAEVSAAINLPMVVVKILLSDLIEHDLMLFRSPPKLSDSPDPTLLQAVLDGIRKI